MKYLTAYYWQQEEAVTSLVLKHLVYRREKLPVIFACVCEENNGADTGGFTRQLTDWFQREGRELCRKDRSELLVRVEEGFRKAFAETDNQCRQFADRKGCKEMILPSVCGLICVGNRFMLFHRGEMRIYLLNTRFAKASCKVLAKETDGRDGMLLVTCGALEKQLGLLMATKSFVDYYSNQQLCECLAASELSSSQRMQKRLKELGNEGAGKGAEHQGAVLIVTQ